MKYVILQKDPMAFSWAMVEFAASLRDAKEIIKSNRKRFVRGAFRVILPTTYVSDIEKHIVYAEIATNKKSMKPFPPCPFNDDHWIEIYSAEYPQGILEAIKRSYVISHRDRVFLGWQCIKEYMAWGNGATEFTEAAEGIEAWLRGEHPSKAMDTLASNVRNYGKSVGAILFGSAMASICTDTVRDRGDFENIIHAVGAVSSAILDPAGKLEIDSRMTDVVRHFVPLHELLLAILEKRQIKLT